MTRIINGYCTNFMLALRLCALDRLFKDGRIRKSRSKKMYLTLSFRNSGLERRAVAVYTEGHTLTHVR